MTTEKEKLKKLMKSLPIPEFSETSKKKTIQAATAEFNRQKSADEKKIKGFAVWGRLKDKTLKGGPMMTKRLTYSIGFAFSLLVAVMLIMPNFVSYRKPGTGKSRDKTAPAEKFSQPTPALRPTDMATNPKAGVAQSAPEINYAPPPVKYSQRLKRSAPASGPPVTHSLAFRSYSAESDGRVQTPNQTYVGRDRFENMTSNPVRRVREEPVSTFSVDVDTAAYAFVRKALHSGVLPQKNAVRIEELVNYFNYDYPLPVERSVPFKATASIYPAPWNPATRLLHIGIKGFDIQPDRKPRANLVFLIDVSGSMQRPDKLPLLKNAFRMLVETLDPEDSVAVVVYAGVVGTVLEPTPVKEKGKILAVLDRLTAGGSTAGGEGIRRAYALAEEHFDPKGVNRVILATDGDFNVGIRSPEELKGFVERKRQTGIFLTVLGFGRGNYNDALMQKLAQNGNGVAAYIDTLNEARKVLVDEARANLFTIAKDVKIQIEFNPTRVAEYRLIGYETRLLRREDFNNDQVDAGDVGAGHSVTAIYEIAPANGNGRLIDKLRYGRPAAGEDVKATTENAETAFLKIRYKLPDAEDSRLLTTAIGSESEYASVDTAPGEARFATAVAAFGQLLRGDPYLKSFDYDDVLSLAETARGRDRFGYRAEFLNLVRLAKSARPMGEN